MNAHWQLWVNSLELILLTNVLIIFKTVPELVSSCVSSHLKCFSCSDNDNYNMNQSSVDHQVSPLIALLLLFVASLINIESKMSMFSVGCVCVCVCVRACFHGHTKPTRWISTKPAGRMRNGPRRKPLQFGSHPGRWRRTKGPWQRFYIRSAECNYLFVVHRLTPGQIMHICNTCAYNFYSDADDTQLCVALIAATIDVSYIIWCLYKHVSCLEHLRG